VSALKRKRPDARTIVLTGYGNIATAVTAVEEWAAVDYLSKPADADDVVAQLLASGTEKSELPHNPMSADRVRWEHIQRIYEMCNRNVSETARRAEHASPYPAAHPGKASTAIAFVRNHRDIADRPANVSASQAHARSWAELNLQLL